MERFFALVAFSFLAAQAAFAADPVRVGVVLPLTGEVAGWGQDVRDALIFAKDKLDAADLEFIFEDDRCNGKDAVTASSKLLAVDHVRYGVLVCTESMLSAASLFEARKVIAIGAVTSGIAVSQSGDYIFRTWPSDAFAAELLVDYLKPRFRKVGVISEERGFAQELARAFSESAKRRGLEFTSQNYLSDTIELTGPLLRLRAAGVDALFLDANNGSQMLNAVKQIRALHWDIPLFGIYIPGNQDFLKPAGDDANGIIFVDGPPVEAALTAPGKALYDEFVSKFGPLRSTPFVFASTFETVRLLKRLSSREGDSRSYLYGTTFDGLFGPYSFDAAGDIVGAKHVMKRIDRREPRLLTAAELSGQ